MHMVIVSVEVNYPRLLNKKQMPNSGTGGSRQAFAPRGFWMGKIMIEKHVCPALCHDVIHLKNNLGLKVYVHGMIVFPAVKPIPSLIQPNAHPLSSSTAFQIWPSDTCVPTWYTPRFSHSGARWHTWRTNSQHKRKWAVRTKYHVLE